MLATSNRTPTLVWAELTRRNEKKSAITDAPRQENPISSKSILARSESGDYPKFEKQESLYDHRKYTLSTVPIHRVSQPNPLSVISLLVFPFIGLMRTRKKKLREDIRFALRAFESRNYRALFWPQAVATCGTWIQHTALGWLVYRLTGSPAWLGAITFLNLFPVFVLSLWAGVIGDRYPRQKILWLTNSGSVGLSVLLAYLLLTHELTVGRIAMLALLQGFLNAIEIPTRQAFFLDLVSHSNLQSAVALNSTTFNLTRLIGPMIAGFAIDLRDESLCFGFNAILRIPILMVIPFLFVDPPTLDRENNGSLWSDLKSGLRYVRGSSDLTALVRMIAGLSFLGVWFPSYLPAVAKDILGGGPRVLGCLYAAVGFGSFIGAYFLARSGSPEKTGPRVASASLVFSIGLVLFSRVGSMTPALLLLFLLGITLTTQNVGANTLIQLLSPDALRGRITSVYTVAMLGVGPVGVLLAGAMAEWIGVDSILGLSGIGCLAVSLFYFRDVKRVVPDGAANSTR